MSAGPPGALVPRRLAGERAEQAALLAGGPRAAVHDQDALLALPDGTVPVLSGDGSFALGRGAVAEARDAVRVCVVEDAALLFAGPVRVAAWEAAAVAGSGGAVLELGPDAWAWLENAGASRARARLRGDGACGPELVASGDVDVRAEGGAVHAGGGAVVHATGARLVEHDASVHLRTTDARRLEVRRGGPPAGRPQDALLDRLHGARGWTGPTGDRLVLVPWRAEESAPGALLQPVVDREAAQGRLRVRSGWRETQGGGHALALDGPVPADLQDRWALPPGVQHVRRDDLDVVLADGPERLVGRRARHWWPARTAGRSPGSGG